MQNPHSTGAESALGPVQNLHPNPLTESFNEPKTRACAREEAITSLEEKQSCPSPEPPDERVDPARVAELVAETVRSFGGNYPPRDPKRSWSEQRDAVAPSRLRDVSFRGEQLAAIRRLGQANLGVPGHA